MTLVETENAPPELVERGRVLVEFGEAAIKLTDKLFARWKAFKRRQLSRPALQRKMVGLKARFHVLFRRGHHLKDAMMPGTCKDLQRQYRVLWT